MVILCSVAIICCFPGCLPTSYKGYRDVQSSADDFEDGRLEFDAEVCDLDIALDKCRGIIIKHSDAAFSVVSERYVGQAWQPFSRADYRRLPNKD